MAGERDARQIVHSGAPQPAVVEQESGRLDQVDGDAEARGEAQHGARILRDVGLVEGEAHRAERGRVDHLQMPDFPLYPSRLRWRGRAPRAAAQCHIRGHGGGWYVVNRHSARGDGPAERENNMARAAEHSPTLDSTASPGETRRDFLTLATAGFGAAGVVAALWPLVHSMNPARDVLAISSTEIDLARVPVGARLTVVWRGRPVFVDHRTAKQIAAAREVALDALRDPETDAARTKKPEWLVVVGICTHLGCIPLGQKSDDPRGEFGGWFCPCHGSQYDESGRIRKGPAPRNLEVPPYAFLPNNVLKIG